MGELETAFEKLTGRQPTDADVQRLYRAKDALGLGSNDALWLLLIALDYHQSLYERIPAQIGTRVQGVLKALEHTAREAMAAESTRAQRTLTEQVAASAKAVAGHMTSRARWRAAALTAGVLLALLVATAWYINTTLKTTWFNAGYYAGEKSVADRVDLGAERWARSPRGRLARVLAEQGLLTPMLTLWSESGEPALDDIAILRRSDAEWLASRAGREARVRSEDGTLLWAEWLRALLDAGALSEGAAPRTPRCEGVSIRGYRWRLVDNLSDREEALCDVWHGRVFFTMNR